MPKEHFKTFLKRVYGMEYGKGEVKTFTPQVKKALRILETESIKHTKTQKKLKELGFRISKSSGVALIGDKQVLKLCFLFNKGFPAPPKNVRVPTLVLETQGYSNLMVQPRVVIPSMKERISIVMDIKPKINRGYDVHEYNVGKYKNKNVLFDW